MNLEQKKADSQPLERANEKNEEILQEYYKSFWRNSKFWLGVVVFFIF